MYGLDEFILFHKGEVETGIDVDEIELVYKSLKNPRIKKNYLLASAPKHRSKYGSFYIKKNLVTLKDFRVFIKDSSYMTDSEVEGWGWTWNGKWLKKKNVTWEEPFLNASDKLYNDHAEIFPVMQISWNDAFAYTEWLYSKTGKKYRLPFEHEWELLAQYAGFPSILNCFQSNDNNKINTDECYIVSFKEKLIQSNFQLGLLWEWMYEWYKGYDESVFNKDFGSVYKTLRGGSLLSKNVQNTKEFRFRRCPTARSPYYGFRIVLISS